MSRENEKNMRRNIVRKIQLIGDIMENLLEYSEYKKIVKANSGIKNKNKDSDDDSDDSDDDDTNEKEEKEYLSYQKRCLEAMSIEKLLFLHTLRNAMQFDQIGIICNHDHDRKERCADVWYFNKDAKLCITNNTY